MGKNGAQRRQLLFDVYAAQASFYIEAITGKFICPLCGNSFGPEALQPDALAVDIAHVYPASCGGRAETLTCRACNNRMGQLYDHQLTAEHRTHDVLQSDSKRTLTGRTTFAGGSVGVEFSRRGGGFIFNEIGEQTNPKERDAFIEAMEEDAKQGKFKFRLESRELGLSVPHLFTALLHSAYLALFRQYGYEYVAFADTSWIQQTLNAEKPPEKHEFVTLTIPVDSGFNRQNLLGAGIIRVNGLKCLGAALPSPDRRLAARLVLVPGLGDEGRRDYQQLRDGLSENVPFDYRLDYNAPEERLSGEGGKWYLHKHWERT